MLSYMLPVEGKPPPAPSGGPKSPLQLTLSDSSNGRTNITLNNPHSLIHNNNSSIINTSNTSNTECLLKDLSISSFGSDTTHSSMTPTSVISDRSKSGGGKVVINGANKHQPLKRVSFGSSKGSMVETLVFESPVQEEPEVSPLPEKNGTVNPFPEDLDQTEAEREKVRVSFYQQSKPQEVDLPDEPVIFDESDFMMAATVAMSETNHILYHRTDSVESGWDNPFRPGGDLSREADEIVELIKGGKPITPTSNTAPLINGDQPDCNGANDSPKKVTPLLSSTPKSANGNVSKTDTPQGKTGGGPGAVDIKRGTVKPEGGEVEHITIKKKPKCKCCVIQ